MRKFFSLKYTSILLPVVVFSKLIIIFYLFYIGDPLHMLDLQKNPSEKIAANASLSPGLLQINSNPWRISGFSNETQEIYPPSNENAIDSLYSDFHQRAIETGMDPVKLLEIDSIILAAIKAGAMPGAQIYVSRRGITVINKTYGYHDYSETKEVKTTDLYDISSITKIAATTIAAMKLVENGSLDLHASLGNYFKDTIIRYMNLPLDTIYKTRNMNIAGKNPETINHLLQTHQTSILADSLIKINEITLEPRMPESNIFRVTLYNLLTHHSGINPSLPISPYIGFISSYRSILEQKNERSYLASIQENFFDILVSSGEDLLMREVKEIDFANNIREQHRRPVVSREEAFNYYYSNSKNDLASIQVTDQMFLRNQFRDSLFQATKQIKVLPKDGYRYSCINMILLQMVIDSVTNTNLDHFMKKEFYQPLGMYNTTFNPLDHFPKERIVPTEYEKRWRRQLIHGTVHDPHAALLGGIAGNAGLFSTASDLGILGQMLLNGGRYNGKQYLNTSTIRLFTAAQSLNHRGLGFNKPSPNGIHASSIPESAYGHSGFTGSVMWVDPENEIVFVFLSNRIHPDASNVLLQELKVRENVQQTIYDAIIN
jgi:CubicO group peptidase (beta-lactamase class C family)